MNSVLEDLLARAENEARVIILDKHKPLPPTWFFYKPGANTAKLSTPWRDDLERELWIDAMRLSVKHSKTLAYSFVAEVWVAHESKEEFESDKPFVQPRHRPDREEMVLSLATDGKSIRSRSWRIIRDWQERITGLEPRDFNGAALTGWAASLLGTPTR